MSNTKVLKRLIKIAESQQKAIIKIAQLSNDMEYLNHFIKSSVMLYLTNNGIFAKDNFRLEESDVPGKDFKVAITLSPATNKPLEQDVAAKLKQFLTAKMLQDPALKSKSIDLDVQTL
jgi:hypothetical protein